MAGRAGRPRGTCHRWAASSSTCRTVARGVWKNSLAGFRRELSKAAAAWLVDSLLDDGKAATVPTLIAEASRSGKPSRVSVHAYESDGGDAIPIALALWLSLHLGIPNDDEALVQTNVVAHTGADGYSRLARQAAFDGPVTSGTEYVMVDDFVGQGGTLANLRGWIAKRGGNVIGAVALTGKPYSVRLNPTEEQLDELRQEHGRRFEEWWKEHFGHAFDCLTHSEARYLARSPDVDTIRDRLAAVQQAGNGPGGRRSPREQRRHIKELRARITERFPHPPRTMRPQPGRWQGYVLARKAAATLRATAALRGLLMRECPEQPPAEWFSGHHPGGKPSDLPRMALVPLPFVGSRYADGAIMGLGLTCALEKPVTFSRNRLTRVLSGLPRPWYSKRTGVRRTKA